MALRQEAFFDRGCGGTDLHTLTADFRRSLLRRELQPSTADIYDWALHGFLSFLERQGVTDSDQLTRDLVERWQDANRTHLGRSSRSITSTAVRQFLRWGVGHGHLDPRSPYWVTHVKGRRTHPRPIPTEDLKVILGYLAERRFAGSLVDHRNRALFFYILSTGSRVSEALQVRRDQVTHAIVRQKGDSEKELESVPIVIEALEEYLAERRDSMPWMWVTLGPNYPMRPLTPNGVLEIWHRMADRLGITPWTTHQLRHTGASELYEAGMDGMVIADWLGHAGMGHVAQYTRIPRARRREALEVLQEMLVRYSDPGNRVIRLRRRTKNQRS